MRLFQTKSIIQRRVEYNKAQQQWQSQLLKKMADDIATVTTNPKPVRGQRPKIYIVKGNQS